MSDQQKVETSPIRVLGLCFLAALLLASYAIVRPASESLFLEQHGSASLMSVWIMVAVAVSVVVPVYNRFSHNKNLIRVFSSTCIVCAILLAGILVMLNQDLPAAHYALYVWKDIYIIILVETFWSLANVVFVIKDAKKTYGLFCASGAIGGLLGNFGGGELATIYGSATVIWATVALLVIIGILSVPLSSGLLREDPAKAKEETSVSLLKGFEVIRKSSYLLWILALIAVTQIVINFVDFEYNRFLEITYPDTDERTSVSSKVYAIIDAGSLILQFSTVIILRVLGIPLTLLAVPAILGISVVSFLIAPGFAVVAVTKVMSKVMDYSVFRAAKEILYIPLSYREKTQGKAVIDMMTYRLAKGLSAVILTVIGVEAATSVLSPLMLFLVLAWLGITTVIVRRYEQAQAKQRYQGS
ncbi:MAG: Npt1/Npt2 family nucleotide transporter [Myxococcota bacterium]|nr:Npt1/Npt2 family nucleotide transporter [Myxococcota bacterium]